MKLNSKRLLKLADFLDKLPRSHFNFKEIRSESAPTRQLKCGTTGCAIGWCPSVFPRLCRAVSIPTAWDESMTVVVGRRKLSIDGEFDENGDWGASHAVAGKHLFDMPLQHAQLLFTPDLPSPADDRCLPGSATPKQVAKRIRTYVKWALKQEKAK